MRKTAASAYHPNGNSCVQRVPHTMWPKMFAIVVNEHQDDWDVHVPRT